MYNSGKQTKRTIKSTMIKFKVLILLFCILTTGNLLGQAKNGMAARISEKQTEKMKADLELEGTQIQKVQKINLKYAEQIVQAMDENKWNPEGQEEKLASIKEERSAELKKVLTKEQWEVYESTRPNKKKNQKNNINSIVISEE
jgi:periplasmic protein CpxP/Spy